MLFNDVKGSKIIKISSKNSTKNQNKMKISILTISAVSTQRAFRTTITNIGDMASEMLIGPFSVADANDYGCTGRGIFSPFDKTMGKPVDEADAAFYKWKKCIQCVRQGQEKTVPAYAYDKTTNSCGKFFITSVNT